MIYCKKYKNSLAKGEFRLRLKFTSKNDFALNSYVLTI